MSSIHATIVGHFDPLTVQPRAMVPLRPIDPSRFEALVAEFGDGVARCVGLHLPGRDEGPVGRPRRSGRPTALCLGNREKAVRSSGCALAVTGVTWDQTPSPLTRATSGLRPGDMAGSGGKKGTLGTGNDEK